MLRDLTNILKNNFINMDLIMANIIIAFIYNKYYGNHMLYLKLNKIYCNKYNTIILKFVLTNIKNKCTNLLKYNK